MHGTIPHPGPGGVALSSEISINQDNSLLLLELISK